MDRSKIRKLVTTGCALAVVGVAIALAAPSIGRAPNDPTAPGTCLEFASEVNPKEVPVDSGYDAEKGIVYAHEGGRTYVLKPDDPTCRSLSGPRSVIDDAVRTDRDNETTTCGEVSRAVADERTNVLGRPFDRDAAKRYLVQRCGGAG